MDETRFNAQFGHRFSTMGCAGQVASLTPYVVKCASSRLSPVRCPPDKASIFNFCSARRSASPAS